MQYYQLFTCIGLIFTFLIGTLQAEEYSPISTSRPGAFNPTTSVPSGLFQFECGTNLYTGPGMDTTLTTPIQLRMGVYKNTELQVTYASEYLILGLLYGGISFLDGFENMDLGREALLQLVDESIKSQMDLRKKFEEKKNPVILDLFNDFVEEHSELLH